ncbi:leucine-rich repeat domain-containing protein [Streptomyces sp. NPDC021098]|uniref:leucine-rich repeat domain-containing protein n=1 Tax=unclassified Streptomyces TaxID=2593676 RepID=UPI00379E6C22
MGFHDHLEELHGLPAFTFPGPGEAMGLPVPDAVAWRITMRYDPSEMWESAFGRFCAEVDTRRVRALIVGLWDDPEDTDPSDGETLRLEFPALRHDALRRLTVQSGGLPVNVVRGVGASELPALEHLDLWLGTSEYGADCKAADLEPILTGARLPRLRHLALRNSEMQDEVAAAVASAPVVARLKVLDLSMGTLSDVGAAALLSGQPLTHLTKLDLHHNYLSEPVRQRIRQALEPAGVEVDLAQDDAERDADDNGPTQRYVSAGE